MTTIRGEIKRNYPNILSLENIRCILHISKRKAAWLLQNGHIGCTIGEKKTRQYSMPRSELIKYIEKCSEGNAPSIPYGIFSTQKYPSQRKENAIRISQTTITNLKIELRAEWSKSPTAPDHHASSKACGMLKRSHKFLDEKGRWASLCKGAKRSVHNQRMADRLLRSLYEREEAKISHFKIKKHPKGIGEISDTFLIKICSDRLTNLKNRFIILYAKTNGNTVRTYESYKTPI